MCHERHCPHTKTDEEVRQGADSATSWWVALARRFRCIQFKLCIHVYKCLHGIAPKYMMNLCWLVFTIEGRSHLRSAARGQLDVPRPKLSPYGRMTFSYAGPSAWNSLPNYLRDNCLTLVMFKRSLRTFCFQSISIPSALDMFAC